MNNPDIDTILDDMIKNKTDRRVTEELLRKENVANASSEIDLHIAAAKALQRYMILQQVRLVHDDFVLTFQADGNRLKLARPRGSIRFIKWAVRVAAIIILAAGGWFIYQYSTNNSADLYAAIYQPYHVNTDRGIEDIITHNMVTDFRKNDFKAVIDVYESLPNANSREKFLAAYSYHQSARYNESVKLFNELLAQNKADHTRLYNDEAEFYLGLSYLKLNNIEQAVPVFEHILSTTDHTFHERISSWILTRLKWLQ